MFRTANTILLVLAGLLNLYPAIGVLSADQLTVLYGLPFDGADLQVLMRHRAVMLGLIGGLMLIAAFKPALQLLASLMGLISMLAFIGIAWTAGDINANVDRVAVADVFGVIAVSLVILNTFLQKRDNSRIRG